MEIAVKLTPEEREEITNQILLVGQLTGLSSRLNVPLLTKWLDGEEVDSDFRYEQQIRAAIRFREESLGG